MRKSASTENIDSATAEVIRKLVEEEKRRMPSRRTKRSVDYRREYISVGVDDTSAISSRAAANDWENSSEEQYSYEPPERCSSVPVSELNPMHTLEKDGKNNIGRTPFRSSILPFVKLEKIEQRFLQTVEKNKLLHSPSRCNIRVKTENLDLENQTNKKNSSACNNQSSPTGCFVKCEQSDSDRSNKNNSSLSELNSSLEKCPHCNMVFNSKNHEISHLNFCFKKKCSFQCEVCGKEFISGNVLKIHLLIHGQKTNKKNNSFPIKCETDRDKQSHIPDQEPTKNLQCSSVNAEKQSDIPYIEPTKDVQCSSVNTETQSDIPCPEPTKKLQSSSVNTEKQSDLPAQKQTKSDRCNSVNVVNAKTSHEKPDDSESVDDDVMIIDNVNDEIISDVISINDDDDEDSFSCTARNAVSPSRVDPDKHDEPMNTRLCDTEKKRYQKKEDLIRKTRRRRKPLTTTKQRTQTSLPCIQCHKTFKSLENLKYHIRMHHSYYKSEIWAGRSPVKVSKSHKHVDDALNCCPCCFKTFMTRHHLLQHLRVCFKKTKSYRFFENGTRCAVKCDGRYSRKQMFKEHKTCPFCYTVFDGWKQMLSHLKTCYDKEWPYQCKVCGMSYKNKRPLMIHKLFHDGSTAVKCTVCNKGFPSSFDLNEHLFEIHPDSIEQTLIASERDKIVRKGVCGIKKCAPDINDMEEKHLKRKRIKNSNHPTGAAQSLRTNDSPDFEPDKSTLKWDFETISSRVINSSKTCPQSNRFVSCTLCDERLPSSAHLSQHILVSHAETIDDEGNPVSDSERKSEGHRPLSMFDENTAENKTNRMEDVTTLNQNIVLGKNRHKQGRVYEDYTYKDNSFGNCCPRCRKKFRGLLDYFDHNCRWVDSSRVCFICLTYYEDGASITEHLNTHRSMFKFPVEPLKRSDMKPSLTCQFCSYSTQTASDLSRHMMFHSDLPGDVRLSRMDFSEEHLDETDMMDPEMNFQSQRSRSSDDLGNPVGPYSWQYHCNMCYERCNSVDFITQHRKQHVNVQKSFSCLHCKNSVFRTSREYVRHSEGHKYPYTCTLCRRVFSTSFELVQHRYSYHELLKMCSRCHKFLPDLNSLRKHWCQHFAERDQDLGNCKPIKERDFRFRCDRCPAKFPAKTCLLSHFKACHVEGSHTCFFCRQVFESSNLKENAEQKIEPIMKSRYLADMKCSICFKKFSVKFKLVKHMIHKHLDEYERKTLASSLRVIPDDYLECTLCDWRFSSIDDWTEHTKNHKILDMKTLRKQQAVYVLALLMKEHSYPRYFPNYDSASDTEDSSETELEEVRLSSKNRTLLNLLIDGEQELGHPFFIGNLKDGLKLASKDDSPCINNMAENSHLETLADSDCGHNSLHGSITEDDTVSRVSGFSNIPGPHPSSVTEPLSTENFTVRLKDATLSDCVVTTCTDSYLEDGASEEIECFPEYANTDNLDNSCHVSGIDSSEAILSDSVVIACTDSYVEERESGDIECFSEYANNPKMSSSCYGSGDNTLEAVVRMKHNSQSTNHQREALSEMQTLRVEAFGGAASHDDPPVYRYTMENGTNDASFEKSHGQTGSEILITEVSGCEPKPTTETSLFGREECDLDLQEAIKIHAMSWKADEYIPPFS